MKPMNRNVSVLALFASCWALTLAGPTHAARKAAAPLVGTVTHVSDGDSLWFKPAAPAPALPIEVRLADIDAPEICQPGGEPAKQALAALALGKTGRLTPLARDSYGRTVAKLEISGDTRQINVAAQLVEDGHAYSARSRNGRGPLLKQERVAAALGRGVHGMPGAVLPAEFRRTQGPCTKPSK
jgi:micrococcal nuclease